MADGTKVILPAAEILKNPEAAARFGDRLIAELPALIFPKDEETVSAQLAKLRALGLRDALAENLGAIRLIREAGLRPYGGHGLNILNSVALAEYEKLGLAEATVSFELPMAKIARLGGTLPRGILGYGYLPLMRFRACPIQKSGGCGACPGSGLLTDRLGKTFSVLCSAKRYSTLLNSLPLWIADKEISGADFLTLYFTVEPPEHCLSVYRAFQKNMPPDTERTNGLYFRELP
jgi:putative protease